jgi:hypothetical protein
MKTPHTQRSPHSHPRRTLLCVSITTLALGAFAGCAAVGPADDEPLDDVTQAVEDPALDGEAGPHARRHPAHGPLVLFEVALRDLDLSQEQRLAVADARDATRPSPDQRATHDAERKQAAEAIRAGNAPAARNGDPHEVHRQALASGLQALHAALTPEQRRVLVAMVDEAPDHKREHRGPSARGGGWKRGHDPLSRMLAPARVNAETRARIDAALAEAGLAPPSRDTMKAHHAAHRERRQAMLAGFARDDFDASAQLTPPADAERPPAPHELLAVVLPLLDDDQRAALATALERAPRRGHHAPPGHHGPPGHRGPPGDQPPPRR